MVTPVDGTREAVDIPEEAATPAAAILVAVVLVAVVLVAVVLIPEVVVIQGVGTQEALIRVGGIPVAATLVEGPTMAAGTLPTTKKFRN